MKITPGKVSASFVLDVPFANGDLVMYENDATPLLAVVLAYKKQKLTIFNERARELEMAPNRLYALPGKQPPDIGTNEKRTGYLSKLRSDAEAAIGGLDVAELWGVVSDNPRDYTTKELCELYYSDNQLLHHLTLRLGLIADKVYFKRAENSFQPRPADVVEQLKKAQQAKLEKARVQALTLEAFKARLKDAFVPFPPESKETLRLLEELAAGAELDHTRQKEAKEVLEQYISELKLELHGPREQQAFDLLERIGYFAPDQNLSLIRHRPELEFSPQALAEAAELSVPASLADYPQSERAPRRDLTHLQTITIDDNTTKDMDDALSLEQTESGYRLWVHISDVAALIKEGTALDKAALMRATSIYLPERTLNMLPEGLSQTKLSLVEGEVRPALSCVFDVSPDFEIKNGRIVPSLIKVDRRYDYEQVDGLLEQEGGQLGILYQIAVTNEMRRLDHGALKVYKHDIAVVLKENGEFELVDVDEHGPARSLIGEMMVLANALMADYLAGHQLPGVFRQQEPPDETDEINVPLGPAHDYAERARLKKSMTALTPGRHAGLGLDAYVQATSPIRRYVDLCNQRQVLHHLATGEPYYSPERLTEILQRCEEPLIVAASVSKETKRYWLLKYLKRRMHTPSAGEKAGIIKGTVLRTDLKNPLVELHEVYFPTLVKVDRALRPGDELTLRISAVEPRIDYLKLELAWPASA